jgi:hypothetical protein
MKHLKFEPYIMVNASFDKSELQFQTDLLLVKNKNAISPKNFSGVDKVSFFVMDPAKPKKKYEIFGEFSCGYGDYEMVSLYLYGHNGISEDLEKMFVLIPLDYVAKVLTRMS